mmetsp:Transcript_833/g.1300  ORF Transcript_833/g.1300 Transcript_833/m.1300 type:complete len:973 (-) Transcript_833:48-2966(-)
MKRLFQYNNSVPIIGNNLKQSSYKGSRNIRVVENNQKLCYVNRKKNRVYRSRKPSKSKQIEETITHKRFKLNENNEILYKKDSENQPKSFRIVQSREDTIAEKELQKRAEKKKKSKEKHIADAPEVVEWVDSVRPVDLLWESYSKALGKSETVWNKEAPSLEEMDEEEENINKRKKKDGSEELKGAMKELSRLYTESKQEQPAEQKEEEKVIERHSLEDFKKFLDEDFTDLRSKERIFKLDENTRAYLEEQKEYIGEHLSENGYKIEYDKEANEMKVIYDPIDTYKPNKPEQQQIDFLRLRFDWAFNLGEEERKEIIERLGEDRANRALKISKPKSIEKEERKQKKKKRTKRAKRKERLQKKIAERQRIENTLLAFRDYCEKHNRMDIWRLHRKVFDTLRDDHLPNTLKYALLQEILGNAINLKFVTIPEDLVKSMLVLCDEVAKDVLHSTVKQLYEFMRMRMTAFGKEALQNQDEGPRSNQSLQHEVRKRREARKNKKLSKKDMAKFHEQLLRDAEDPKMMQKIQQHDVKKEMMEKMTNIPIPYSRYPLLPLAYTVFRTPSLYSVSKRVLHELVMRYPSYKPTSFLDFGTGSGTFIRVLSEHFNEEKPTSIIAVEPHTEFINIAKHLLEPLNLPIVWRRFLSKTHRQSLTSAIYTLNEIVDVGERKKAIKRLWDMTDDVMVILEPGTPLGSQIVQEVRNYVLFEYNEKASKENQATILAPCPHDMNCPMANSPYWCHFKQRHARPNYYRSIKKKSLSKDVRLDFEHEPYSYLIVARKSFVNAHKPPRQASDKVQQIIGSAALDVHKRLKLDDIPLPEIRDWGVDSKDKSFPYMLPGLLNHPVVEGWMDSTSSMKRVVNSPILNKHHVYVDFCHPQGFLTPKEIYTKSIGRLNGYNAARQALRGHLFSFPIASDVNDLRPSYREREEAYRELKLRERDRDREAFQKVVEPFDDVKMEFTFDDDDDEGDKEQL